MQGGLPGDERCKGGRGRVPHVLLRGVGLFALGLVLGSIPIRSGEFPARPAEARLEDYGSPAWSFEANVGQTDPRVKFLSRGRGYTLFLTGEGAVLLLRERSAVSGQRSVRGNSKLETGKAKLEIRTSYPDPRTLNPEPRAPSVLRLKLAGANAHVQVLGLEELPGTPH